MPEQQAQPIKPGQPAKAASDEELAVYLAELKRYNAELAVWADAHAEELSKSPALERYVELAEIRRAIARKEVQLKVSDSVDC